MAIACRSDSMGCQTLLPESFLGCWANDSDIFEKCLASRTFDSRDDLNFCVLQNFIGQDDDIFSNLVEILLIND